MNFALALSTNRLAGVVVDWTPALSPTQPLAQTASLPAGDAAAQKEAQLEAVLLDAPASATTRGAVLSQGTDATAQAAAQQFTAGGGRVLTDAERLAMLQDRADSMMESRREGKGVRTEPAAALPRAKGAGGMRGQLGAAPLVAGPPPVDRRAAAMAGLLLGSPEFQRR